MRASGARRRSCQTSCLRSIPQQPWLAESIFVNSNCQCISRPHTFIPIESQLDHACYFMQIIYAHRDLTTVNRPNQPRLFSTESVSYARERDHPQITRLSIDSPCLT